MPCAICICTVIKWCAFSDSQYPAFDTSEQGDLATGIPAEQSPTWGLSREVPREARDEVNVTDKLRRDNAPIPTTCSSLKNTITTLCGQGGVARVALPQGLCSISSQIEIPMYCDAYVSGTIGTTIDGTKSTRHFYVPSVSTLTLESLTLQNGRVSGSGEIGCGVSKHSSLIFETSRIHLTLNLTLGFNLCAAGFYAHNDKL